MSTTSKLKPKNVVANVKNKTSNKVKQVVSDYSKASPQKKESELIGKLGVQKTANAFTKLSKDLDLRVMNNAVSVVPTGSNEPLGEIQSLPERDVPALNMDSSGPSEQYKVRLVAIPKLGGEAGDEITFDVMPSITETQNAQYDTVDVVHHPGAILKYKSTSAREWGITADLVSRTVEEATENLRRLNLIRSWLMPFYGTGSGESYPEQLGAPPQILKFYGFGPKMIGEASVVLTNFNWTFEPEVDYIYAGTTPENRTPFPVLMRIQLSLSETWSPRQFTQFNLRDYREGNMPAAFGGTPIATRTNPSVDASRLSTAEPQMASTSSILTATIPALGAGATIRNNFQTGTSTVSNAILNAVRSPGPI